MSVKTKPFPRFDRLERVVHWCNATLFLVLLLTGASLYAGPLSTIVAHRHAVKTIHVYAGLLLPVPLLLGLLMPSGRQLRRDVSRFNRWTVDDRRWWSRRTRASAQLGKFNPGQKLNAVFVAASIVLMLTTGSIMRWFEPFPDNIRTGATFVHDWIFIALIFVIVGHIMFALADFDSLRSMVRGWVPEQWARRERPRWWAEVVAARSASGGPGEASGEPGEASGDSAGDVEAGLEQRVDKTRVRTGEMPVGD
ncbi:MAG: cytochrome b/b6 domain-containing protein [Actinomycetota bacterium]|nr:cytochrome b/b6 domain-containing protein [Actinomycetota bacterium]